MHKIFAGILMMTGLTAHAEQFDLVIDLRCGGSSADLEISLEGHWWSENPPVLSATQITPRSLLETSRDESGRYSWTERTESWRCELGENLFLVEITPQLASGFHPEGYCATRTGARVVVREAGRPVAETTTDACTEADDGFEVIRMVVAPGRATTYTKIPSRKFFWPD